MPLSYSGLPLHLSGVQCAEAGIMLWRTIPRVLVQEHKYDWWVNSLESIWSSCYMSDIRQ